MIELDLDGLKEAIAQERVFIKYRGSLFLARLGTSEAATHVMPNGDWVAVLYCRKRTCRVVWSWDEDTWRHVLVIPQPEKESQHDGR